MKLLSYFSPKMPVYLVYMLQQVEYDPRKFLEWVSRFPNLSKVMHRQKLVLTNKSKLLVAYSYLLGIAYIVLNIQASMTYSKAEIVYLLFVPIWVIFMLFISVLIAWNLIEKPRREKEIGEAKKIFAGHKAVKIAILGSYGTLGSAKKVKATPGNKNVLISQARWAKKLSGEEDVLLVEYGEGQPGDIKNMAELTHPDIAIICGLAPNHLDQYKTLDAVAKDLFSISEKLKKQPVYVNTESQAVKQYLQKEHITFSRHGLDNWKISQVESSLEGISFAMSKGKNLIKIKSGLIGRHQIGPLALCAVIAHNLGLSNNQIEKAISQTAPFEHRMQPRTLGGGWIIDDTYNGNLEGILAGLELLKDTKAKRKVYATPGLVDQGEETERVHKEMGKAIAKARPSKVILMQNSVTKFIKSGLEKAGYTGDLEIRDDPLAFYTNIDQYIAAGDVWLLQNDWTDNYF
jgi:UDP-N-acetylmuramoyl-tripeptide--D-alanyl-D-alanine ligase